MNPAKISDRAQFQPIFPVPGMYRHAFHPDRFDYGPSSPVPDSGKVAGPPALLLTDRVAL